MFLPTTASINVQSRVCSIKIQIMKEIINKLMEINISSAQMALQCSWLSRLDYCEIYTNGNTSGRDNALKGYKI